VELFFRSGVREAASGQVEIGQRKNFSISLSGQLHEQEDGHMFQTVPCTLEASNKRWLDVACVHASEPPFPT